MASFATCRSALFAPLLSLLLAAVALAQQRVCPISDLDQFNNIARVCCEGSTGAVECSAGFPPTCTRACAELLEPFWTKQAASNRANANIDEPVGRFQHGAQRYCSGCAAAE